MTQEFKPIFYIDEVEIHEIDDYDSVDLWDISENRKHAYDQGYWKYIGISAVVKIAIKYEDFEQFGSVQFESGGIWGIESDDEDNIKINSLEQLDEVKQIIKNSGINVEIDENKFNLKNVQFKEISE